jgi:hypothetical protein
MSFINNITNSALCQGWVNPSNNFYGPQITSLSSYYSPAGSSTIVSIIGTNFYSYSTITFGTYAPTVYFINSLQMDFYIPNTLSAGTYPVQVFNGSVASNIVNYTIDNASGYWLLNANNSISNTNANGLSVKGTASVNGGLLTPLLIISADGQNVGANYSGGFVEIPNTSTVTNITIFSAFFFSGSTNATLTIYNGSPNNVTINSPSNFIIATSGSSATTYSLSSNSIIRLYSNGTNWIVG